MLQVDILLAVLVLFPWLTEGLSLELPGTQPMEMRDLAVPIVVALLVATMVRASTARSALELLRAVPPALARAPRKALARAAAALAGLVIAALLWRYWQRENPGFGLAALVWILTHGTGAIVLVVMIGEAVHRLTGEPWERSFFVRHGMRLARAWPRAVERSPALALWTAAAAVGALYFWVALVRHWAFESHGFDLGIFTNAIWNLTQGNGYVSAVKGGINLFADHQSPLFWLLAPLFWLVPRPETLLFAQAFGLAAGGPALFYLGRAYFGHGHWAIAALPWLYWSYAPLRSANAFDFHPEVFMLPLFLWAFVGFLSQRHAAKALGLLALVGALGAKESAAVVAAGIGVAWALAGGTAPWRARWPGVALAAAGVALFFFDVKVVPRLFGDDYAYMGMYERFGGGITELLLAPFTQPAYFFSQVLDHHRIEFLFWTLAPLGFLPLFNWRAALAAVPPYLMLFLAEGGQRVRLVFHYGIEPGTALFWALPFGLAVFARRFGWQRAGTWMLLWAAVCHGPGEIARARSFEQYLHAPWLAQAVRCIDARAPVAASDTLVPHLATRAWVSYLDRLHQVPSGEPVSCVVTDLAVSNWPLGREGTRRVLASLPQQGYRQVLKCQEFTVYERQGASCLRCAPGCY